MPNLKILNKEGRNLLLIQFGNRDSWQCNKKRFLKAIGDKRWGQKMKTTKMNRKYDAFLPPISAFRFQMKPEMSFM